MLQGLDVVEEGGRLKGLRLALLLTGVGITFGSWFLDRAVSYPTILRRIARDYIGAKSALDLLDEDEKTVVDLDYPGAQVLLSWWNPYSILDPLIFHEESLPYFQIVFS